MENSEPMPRRAVVALGLALTFLAVFALTAIVAVWPAGFAGDAGPAVSILFGTRKLPRETDLLLIAMAFGALGSFLHLAKSFATFVGNRALVGSWLWWYCLQPLVGIGLAVVFYVMVRGGLLSSGASAADISPCGPGGICGLAGMFSKQATDKLNEVFSTMFPTDADSARGDKLLSEPRA